MHLYSKATLHRGPVARYVTSYDVRVFSPVPGESEIFRKNDVLATKYNQVDRHDICM